MQINKLKNLIEQNNNGAGDLVIAEGLHAVKHALRFEAQLKDLVCRNKVDIIKLAQKLCPDVLDLLNQYLVEIGDDFDKLSKSKIRTGILGIFKKPRNHSQLIGGWDEGLKVLLDSPKDLNNIGAVIRVCAAAGIKNLI
ncbi:MAG TPA: hypothetical protein P5247_01595, partial [Candidatus Saccharimonadales bacterium]|nr:hypothetical protein [Candidatus Saccharimonadales bacterium]